MSMLGDPRRRCRAMRDSDGRRCLLNAHDEETSHVVMGAGWERWGGKCRLCGKSVEERETACKGDHVH